MKTFGDIDKKSSYSRRYLSGHSMGGMKNITGLKRIKKPRHNQLNRYRKSDIHKGINDMNNMDNSYSNNGMNNSGMNNYSYNNSSNSSSYMSNSTMNKRYKKSNTGLKKMKLPSREGIINWLAENLGIKPKTVAPKKVYPNAEMFDSRFSGTSYNPRNDAQIYLDGLRRERQIRDDYLDVSPNRDSRIPQSTTSMYNNRYSIDPSEFSSRGRTAQPIDLESETRPRLGAGRNVEREPGTPIVSPYKSTTPKKPKNSFQYKPYSDFDQIYSRADDIKAIEDAQRPTKSTTPRRPSMAQLMSNIEAPPVVARRGSNSRYLMVNGIPTKSPFPEMDAADVWLSGQPRNKIKNQTKLITDKVKDDMLKSYSKNKKMAKRANWPSKNKYF